MRRRLLLTLLLVACGQPRPRPADTAQVPLPRDTTTAPQAQPTADTSARSPAPRGSADTSTPALWARVDTLIGDARCRTAADCRLVGLGAKPCGGPRLWRVYSITQTDSVALARLGQELTNREMAENARLGRIGDCKAVPPPRLAVVDGRCTLVQ